jgi:hypothetical protein
MYIRHFPDLERFFHGARSRAPTAGLRKLNTIQLQATVAGVINDRLKARGVR